MTKEVLSLTLLAATAALLQAEPPGAAITNGTIHAKLYLPDAQKGFYRGTRFDWSGVIHSLQFQGHDYYGPWFTKTDPKVHDFIYDGDDIIAGPCSATTGPADEFRQLGFDAAKPGGNFVKIGIGALRKPDDARYDSYRLYEVADGGKWTIRKQKDSITFTQQLTDASSGYGYIYRKTVRLTKGKAEMVLEHSLKNTGTRAIETTVYNHNFLVLDKQPPGEGVVISVPYSIQSSRPPKKDLAEIRGNDVVYLKTLAGKDVVTGPLEGFGATAKDHEIRIESKKLGAGMSIRCDRPLASEYLWSIRSTLSMEPFVAVSIETGKEFTWTTTYSYYTLPATK